MKIPEKVGLAAIALAGAYLFKEQIVTILSNIDWKELFKPEQEGVRGFNLPPYIPPPPAEQFGREGVPKEYVEPIKEVVEKEDNYVVTSMPNPADPSKSVLFIFPKTAGGGGSIFARQYQMI